MKRNILLFILPAIIVIALDQVSKLLIVRFINYHEAVPVIDGFFHLVHVRNRGMAFGFMNRPDNGLIYLLLVITVIVAILVLFYWFYRLRNDRGYSILGISFILGGAVGNLIDRIRLKEVIDFLDFFIGRYHWPSFNIADSAITIGALWIAINVLFLGKPDDRKVK